MPTMVAFRFSSKNIHEEALPGDGVRVLVERSWPRDLAREEAHIDLWLAEAAPSAALRHRFDSKAVDWENYCHSYRAELGANAQVVRQLQQLGHGRPVTLLYVEDGGTRNHATVLAEYLAD
jgi:uncharacterized protein YeaO (DUF488 family)